MSANSKYMVPSSRIAFKRVDTEPGQFVTNCTVCNKTCHVRCGIAPPESKEGCCAMSNG